MATVGAARWQHAVRPEANHEKPSRPCSPLLTAVADGHEAVTDCYVAAKSPRASRVCQPPTQAPVQW